jgi:hypothetical protein
VHPTQPPDDRFVGAPLDPARHLTILVGLS